LEITIMSPQKIGGVIAIILGGAVGIIAFDRDLVTVTTCLGLQLIFFAKERVNDERVQQLKMKAMFLAMSVGMAVMLVANHYFFVILRRTLDSMPPRISAWEAIAGIMLIALGLYHYWRWQDGREGGDQKPNAVNH
jgi:FtsH-binding integral membrane protein